MSAGRSAITARNCAGRPAEPSALGTGEEKERQEEGWKSDYALFKPERIAVALN